MLTRLARLSAGFFFDYQTTNSDKVEYAVLHCRMQGFWQNTLPSEKLSQVSL